MASVKASFWRGGTSRGLIFRATDLAPFSQKVRENIICTAMGSPDPDLRQINGLGGGVSSLSKICVIGTPGEGREDQNKFGALPGVEWADDEVKSGCKDGGWDVVYRFGQVGVSKAEVDWSSTCGNMLSAVAYSSFTNSLIPFSRLFSQISSLRSIPSSPTPGPPPPITYPIRILSANTGKVLTARVPIDALTMKVWDPPVGKGVKIAGVPGEAAGIELEFPIESEVGAGEGGWMTGRERDVVTIDGKEIEYSFLTAGLPNIFLSPSALGLPTSTLTRSPASLDSDPTIHPLLQSIRQAVCEATRFPLSPSAPKICLVGPLPSESQEYTTSGGDKLAPDEMDCVVRAVSVGNFHRTVPGTTLSALAIGKGLKDSTIHQACQEHARLRGFTRESDDEGDLVTVRAANPAGAAESSVRMGKADGSGKRKADAVVMVRTAREIMRGELMVPERDFYP